MLGKIKFVAFLMAGTAGIIWIVNLPYPMIRKPVSRIAPLLLLPSFISMDNNYRGAINSLEQADQLLSRATSTADIELGGEKVKAAQQHLEHLPVWFLGYYPQRYCTLFSCSWKFTFDEFEQARKRAARLEAVAFQNKNAIVPLNQARNDLATAKQQYEQAKNTEDREKAIANWQTAIDQLEQISQQTLAGKTAKTQLVAYKRDFDNARVATFITAAQEFDAEAQKVKSTNSPVASELWQQAINRLQKVPNQNPRYLDAQKLMATYQVQLKTVNNSHSSTYIAAAKQYALAAAQAAQNPPHSVQKWQQIEQLWEQSIQQLQNIKVREANYVEAQGLIAQYQTHLGSIRNRRLAESNAQEMLNIANQEIQGLIAVPPSNNNQAKARIVKIMNQLNSVKSGTTSYPEAQRLLKLANNRLQQIQ